LRILHVVSDLDRGGVEKQMIGVIHALPNLEHHVYSLLGDGPLSDEIGNNNTIFSKSQNPFQIFLELRNSIRQIQPDIVQTWMFHSDLIGGLATMGTGTPVIWSYHASKLDRKSLKFTTYLVIKLLSLLSYFVPRSVIACSQSSFDAALKNRYSKKKITIIHNGIDTNYYVPNSEIHARTERVVVLPARWHVHKGHSFVLEAWKLLKENEVPGKLVLMGYQVDESNIELNRLIEAHGISETVSVLGEISDMRAVYQSADIIVISSLTEAMPLVLVEAMACGLVPVVTDVGDMREMIGRAGSSCQAGNAQALSQALEFVLLMNDSTFREQSRLSHELAMKKFDIHNTATNYAEKWSMIFSQFPVIRSCK